MSRPRRQQTCRRRTWSSCSRATATRCTADPSSLGGGEADKHLIYEGLSRVAADAVLAGARTIRRRSLVLSVWRPELVALRAAMALPRHPIQIVATLRGHRPRQALMFNVPALRVIMHHRVRAAPTPMRDALKTRPWITLVVMDSPSGLPRRLQELRRLGIERLSCIGGRTLAGSCSTRAWFRTCI